MKNKVKWLLIPLIAISMFGTKAMESHAADTTGNKQVIKKAAIGAGTGAILGGLAKEGSIVNGAIYGAAAGTGVGLIDKSKTMNRKPLVKKIAKGAIVGTAVTGATNKSKLKGAAVGAGAGFGWHYLSEWFK